MTLVGGPGNKGQQEKSYLDALGSAAGYRVQDNHLEIRDAAGETTLHFEQKAQWTSDPVALVGTAWKLHSLSGKPPLESSTPTLAFDSKTEYTGYDGCQHLTGTYYANTDDLEFTSGGVKELDCMKPEAWSGRGGRLPEASVGEKGDYRLSEGQLEIYTDAGDTYAFVPLREGEKVERPGAPWMLEKFVERGTVTPALEGTEITLTFNRGTLRESGTVSGSAGCNTYAADYTYHRDSLTLKTRAVTEMACEDPAGVMEQEQRYLSFFESVNGYYQKIDGRLHLIDDDGRELVFTGRE